MTAPERHVGSPEWLRAATASKIAAMLGESRYASPKELWLKMAYPDRFADTPTAAQARGTLLEAGFIEKWYQENPRYQRLSDGEITITRTDLGFPAAATPDGKALDTETGEIIVLDHKTSGRYANSDEWGEPGSDIIPADYLWQLLWQMHMTHSPDGDKVRRAALIKSGPFIDDQATYWLSYDAGLAADVTAIVAAFMQSIIDGIEPENDTRAGTYRAIARAHNEFDDELTDWEIAPELAVEYLEALAMFDQADGRLNLAKSTMLTAIGRARRAIVTLEPPTGRRRKPRVAVIATRQQAGHAVKLVRPRKEPDMDELRALTDPFAAVVA